MLFLFHFNLLNSFYQTAPSEKNVYFCSYVMRFIFIPILILFLTLFSQYSWGQTTVSGIVTEDNTIRPVPFAKVYFMGTQVGTTTDTSGYFSLKITDKSLIYDTLVVTLLGFTMQRIPVARGTEQQFNIQLKSSLFLDMEEVTAVAGENTAWRYMRKIIENKPKNNPANLQSYSSSEYSKIRFDLNNFTDKIKKNIILKPFDYIWENTQKTEDGITYLPTLLTEKATNHYFIGNPRDEKNIIVGEKSTGLAGPNLVKFTEDLYLTPNIYDNYVTILGKSFPSPLNDNYKNNYKFYLMDSSLVNGRMTYKIRFRPKFERDLAFTGEMYFDSASYAITEINLRFDVQANVNFVRSYYISQYYDEVEPNHWMLTESQVLGDFTVIENSSDLTGFFGRKKAVFNNYSINQPIDPELFKGVEIVSYSDSAKMQNDTFWEQKRTTAFSEEEKILIDVTKRVIEDPAFKFRKNLFYTIGTGYIPLKGVQIGNVYTFYSYNQVEYSRVKLGSRTDPNNKFPVHFEGYLAYGTRDKEWKYRAATFSNLTPKHKATRIGASYQFDIDQLGRSYNQLALDHIVGSLSQLGNSNSRNYVANFEAFFEKEIATGFIGRITYFNKATRPTLATTFTRWDEIGNIVFEDNYITSGFNATFKFSFLYKEIKGTFYDKKDLFKQNRKFPDIAVSYEFADKTVFKSDYNYQKVKINIHQRVNAKKMGYFNYSIEGGKTIGTVPHISLDIPFGNQLIFNDAAAFNLMRFMEFGADQYIAIQFDHHFNGLILDRIPLINKLKWRSYIFGKTFIGNLSTKNNQQTYLFPVGIQAINNTYIEVGFGIENIFKIASIDFTWRLTSGIGEYYTFLVKPSFKLSF